VEDLTPRFSSPGTAAAGGYPARSFVIIQERTEKDNMSSAVAVSEATFEQEVLKSDVPVVVDFWAPGCGPCRQIAPLLDQLAQEYAGRVKIVKVNVDDERSLAIRYGVMSIPTLIFFKQGAAVDQSVGLLPKDHLARKLEALLN
jgi:thioredoxin 1